VTALDRSECLGFWGSANVLDQHLCVIGMDTPEGAGACNVSYALYILRVLNHHKLDKYIYK